MDRQPTLRNCAKDGPPGEISCLYDAANADFICRTNRAAQNDGYFDWKASGGSSEDCDQKASRVSEPAAYFLMESRVALAMPPSAASKITTTPSGAGVTEADSFKPCSNSTREYLRRTAGPDSLGSCEIGLTVKIFTSFPLSAGQSLGKLLIACCSIWKPGNLSSRPWSSLPIFEAMNSGTRTAFW